jgi:hypothetical protein
MGTGVATPRVPYAPEMNTVRIVKVNDAALPNARKFGISCADYDEVAVQLILKNGCTTATVEAHYWSEEAGAFLPLVAPVVVTGSGVRQVVRVARALSVFWEVTAIAGGSATAERVFIELSGLPKYNEVG